MCSRILGQVLAFDARSWEAELGKDSSAPSDLSGTIYGDQSQSPKKAASTLLSLKNRLSPRVDFFREARPHCPDSGVEKLADERKP